MPDDPHYNNLALAAAVHAYEAWKAELPDTLGVTPDHLREVQIRLSAMQQLLDNLFCDRPVPVAEDDGTADTIAAINAERLRRYVAEGGAICPYCSAGYDSRLGTLIQMEPEKRVSLEECRTLVGCAACNTLFYAVFKLNEIRFDSQKG